MADGSGKGYKYENHEEPTLKALFNWIKDNVKAGHVNWIERDEESEGNKKRFWRVLHLVEKED